MKQDRRCLICNCEKTMPLDAKKLSAAMGEKVENIHVSLCRAQISSFEEALNSSDEVLVACTQEAPLFQEIADEQNAGASVNFVNIREAAGWSADAGKASPKIAALTKASTYEVKPARLKQVYSDGMCLVYGSGAQAMEAARLLSTKLSVTVMLSDDEPFDLPVLADVPVYRGTIVQVAGSFGEFSLTVDNYAPMRPASRTGPEFGVARNGATSNCSVILDLSGGAPLLTGHRHRDGYERADPGDPAAVLRKVLALSEMVGEFEKPIYVDYNSETCAHSRSGKAGCSKCLDVCPAGAITDAGDLVEIDPGICGGCGSCHSVCPTGSITYNFPPREDFVGRAQSLLKYYGDAGGKNPVVLVHDNDFGVEMIAMLARHGKGLPANVLPLATHAVSTVGHVELLGLIASGASQVIVLGNPEQEEELTGLLNEYDLANTIHSKLWNEEQPRLSMIVEPDPDLVEERLWAEPITKIGKAAKPASFNLVGSKRDMARIVFAKLLERSNSKIEVVSLPAGAPYGKININEDACTLCMACTSACPANAVTDTPGEPRLRFVENACVQCGLCVSTCPENALELEPQLNLSANAMQPETLYEEEPFCCIACGTPFATQSTIERISEQLAGKHSMFSNAEQSKLIKMCENCRIEAQANSEDDPFSGNPRPRPRTTEDYIAAESGNLSASDFLIDDDS